MPSVAPEVLPVYQPKAGNSNGQDLSQQSMASQSTTNSLRSMAGAAAIGFMALTNSEPANAQSAVAPNPPPGHQAYVQVQGADGKMMLVPVVTSIPQGYQQAPGAPVYTVPAAPVQQGNLPVYIPGQAAGAQASPSQQGQPAVMAPNAPTIPVAAGAQGVPAGDLRTVSYGANGAPVVGHQVTSPQVTYSPSGVPTLGPDTTIPGAYVPAPQAAQRNVNTVDPRVTALRTEAAVLREQANLESIQNRRALNNARTGEALNNIHRNTDRQRYEDGVRLTGSWLGGTGFLLFGKK